MGLDRDHYKRHALQCHTKVPRDSQGNSPFFCHPKQLSVCGESICSSKEISMSRAASTAALWPRKMNLRAVSMRLATGPIYRCSISPSMSKSHGSLLAGDESDLSSFDDIVRAKNRIE